ncbi:TonB-dependent receptor [Rudanella lutea]|uniref:TonB-dependent receptor n=1 Tax=Rudanella lutea TaxID=451374 RepID=UPI0003A1F597|nr:TonB-dependent receptor [Rudanella lutea]
MKKQVCMLLVTAFSVAAAQAQTITGVVRDATSDAPITDVTVQLRGTGRGTRTDVTGGFGLESVPKTTPVLRVTSVGYEPLDIPVDPNGQRVVVRLKPSVVQLNGQTVTTAQRTETADFDRPEVTSVLSARALRQRAPRTVPEALFGTTGVFIQKTNHGGGSPFVRGLTGQQTLLLVDGIRLNNGTFRSGPNQYLNTIDPQSVSQIEVVRSTGSVAYGSDAIGGVVNVLTKTPQFADAPTVSGSAFAKLATQGMEYSGRMELGYSSRSVAVGGGLAYRKFGDLVAGRGLGRLAPTGYSQLSGDVKARFRLSERTLATVAYQDLSQDSVPLYHRVRLENYQYAQFDPQRRQLAYARLERSFSYRFLESVQLTASWQQQSEGRQSRRNNNPTAVLENDQTRTTGLTLLALAQPASFWRMQTGIDWYADRVRSRREDLNTQTGAAVAKRGLYPDRASMNSLAVFSLHTLTFDRLTLTGGARYQANAVTVPEVQPGGATIRPSALVGNVGASYAVWPSLRVFGSVQSAFRSPNIDDLGTLGIVDFRYEVPNTNLRPERSLNTEAGIKLRHKQLALTLLGYHNRLTDFISRVRQGKDSLQGYPVYLKQNSAKSFIRGLEGDIEYGISSRLLAYAGASYTYGQNVTANEPFRRIPPLNGRVGLSYTASGWWLRGEWVWAGAQTRLAKGDQDDNRIAKGGTPGWQVLNLNGGYRWRWLTLSAELQNLMDEAYRTHGSGVDGVGRSAWLSVLVNW